MKKRIINPNAPDEYKYETDYRKIPREYLDQKLNSNNYLFKIRSDNDHYVNKIKECIL